MRPAYFETERGETTLLAQFRHNIAIRSPVATSGTMQSQQNKCLHLWHCLKRVVERTLPHKPHSSLIRHHNSLFEPSLVVISTAQNQILTLISKQRQTPLNMSFCLSRHLERGINSTPAPYGNINKTCSQGGSDVVFCKLLQSPK